MYRGKDFLPPTVASALAERQEMTKQIQDVEEKVRGGPVPLPVSEDKGALAGTLAEFYEAQARWGTEVSADEQKKMIEEASRAKHERVIRRLEHKLAIVSVSYLLMSLWIILSSIFSDQLNAFTGSGKEAQSRETAI